MLVQILKLDLGMRYNPDRLPLSEDVACFLAYFDSRDLLIHGPLGPTRAGTCNNIPMAVVAVGRELGYPLYLATNGSHVWVKWVEPNGHTLNIEASNPAGMTSQPDSYYGATPRPLTDAERRSGCYLRAMTPAEELALCLVSRAWVLEVHRQYMEAAACYAKALTLSPSDPMYLYRAGRMVGMWLRDEDNRRQASPKKLPPAPDDYRPNPTHDPRELLSPDGATVVLTLLARRFEAKGLPANAMSMYAEAFRLRPHGRAQRGNLERVIRNIAGTSYQYVKPVVSPRLRKVESDPRYCLGLPLGFYAAHPADPAAAANASHYGDRLASLGRVAEATIAYAEAFRLDQSNTENLGKCRWAARAFVTGHAEGWFDSCQNVPSSREEALSC